MAFPVGPANGAVTTVNNVTYVYNSTNATWTRANTTSGLTGGTFSMGNLSLTGSVNSTSSSTGTLIVQGGVGVAGNVVVGGASSNILLGYTSVTTSSAGSNFVAAGNVGIGTNSPSYPLHINSTQGQVYLNSSTGTNYVRYVANNTGGSFQFGIDNSAGSNYFGATAYGRAIFSDGAYPMGIFTNGSERMRIDAGGNVMIGYTASPTTTAASGNHTISGNVGIGTNSPGNRLQVTTAGQSTDGILVNDQTSSRSVSIRPNMGSGNNNGIVQAGDSGIIYTAGVNTGAFVIAPWNNTVTGGISMDEYGNVSIGTATQTGRFAITGDAGDNATITLTNSAANAWKIWNDKGASGLNLQYNGATKIVVDSTGNMIVGNTSTDTSVRMVLQNSGAQNVAHFRNYSGTRASPTENSDWPWPVLALTSYSNFYTARMLSFTLPNDANSQPGGIYHTDDSVWSISLNGVTGVNSWDNASASTTPSSASSSEVGIQFTGPGHMRLGSSNAKSVFLRANATDYLRVDGASSGNVVIMSTTTTADSTTGALVVKGGMGVGGDIQLSGNVIAPNFNSYHARVTVNLGSAPVQSTTVYVLDPRASVGERVISTISGYTTSPTTIFGGDELEMDTINIAANIVATGNIAFYITTSPSYVRGQRNLTYYIA